MVVNSVSSDSTNLNNVVLSIETHASLDRECNPRAKTLMHLNLILLRLQFLEMGFFLDQLNSLNPITKAFTQAS